MFYTKNLPTWERIARVVAGIAVGAAGPLADSGTLAGAGLAASGILVGMTGFLGFCPMCALVGRKLDKS